MSADLLLPLPSPTTFIAPYHRRPRLCGGRLPASPVFTPTFPRHPHPSSASLVPIPGEKGLSPRIKRKFEDLPPSPLAFSRCERSPRCVKHKRPRGGAPHPSILEPLAPSPAENTCDQRMSSTMEAENEGQEMLHEVNDQGPSSRPFSLRSPLDLSFASAQVHRFSHPSSFSFSSSNADFHSPPAVISSPWPPQPAGTSTASDPTAMLPPPLAAPAPTPATAATDVPFAIPSSTRRSSSPSFAQPPPSLNRNPKKLSLSLTMPVSPVVAGPTSSAASSSDTIVPTPSFSSNTTTPFTPGPPKTPALALSVGKNRAIRRPSLLSLITQPPTGPAGPSGPAPMLSLEAPPTGGLHGSFFASTSAPGRPGMPRARSNTTDDGLSRASGSGSSSSSSSRSSRSAYPTLNLPTFKVIQEDQALTPSGLTTGLSISPPSTLSTTPSSCSLSLRTTPASSPPLVERQPEPYEDGPIEVVPGIWLGAEESVTRYDVWARGIPTSAGESSAGPSKGVRVLNVAQEVDDPFAQNDDDDAAARPTAKGKEKAKRREHPAVDGVRPAVDYVHLRWGHGEAGLAEIDPDAELDDILSPGTEASDTSGGWRFWQAIRWIEQARRNNEPVLIHCQCGVSRSATLSIAYIMALAATGQMPHILGEINSMQAAYDFVKAKSPCIGPNVSLVFQLVEFAKNVSSLLSKHLARPENASLRNKTRFPTRSETLSEDEWARQRRAFDQEQDDDEDEDVARIASPDEWPSFARTNSAYSTESWLTIPSSAKQRPAAMGHAQGDARAWAEHMSPEEVEGEARRLDEEMIRRRLARV